MNFTKMHGAGNDYVYIDCFSQPIPAALQELAVEISDRHVGVGSDGLILIEPTENADARMRMFNADGSESEMCGNGIRCVAKYMYEHGICQQDTLRIETGSGVLELSLRIVDSRVEEVTVDMGEPITMPNAIPTTICDQPVIEYATRFDRFECKITCISMGNPHSVLFVPSVTDELVLEMGPKIENDPRFPNRTNVEFVEVISPTVLRQRTWERGSGETLACGTGACAVAVAGVLCGKSERDVLIHLRGGLLQVRWDESSNHVFMTGGATEVFTGTWLGR